MNKRELQEKLKSFIIDKKQSKWRQKRINILGQEVEIPDWMNGYILLKEDTDDQGRVKGWIVIDLDSFVQIINDIADPNKPNITEESTGYKKYLDEWRKKGIDI